MVKGNSGLLRNWIDKLENERNGKNEELDLENLPNWTERIFFF